MTCRLPETSGNFSLHVHTFSGFLSSQFDPSGIHSAFCENAMYMICICIYTSTSYANISIHPHDLHIIHVCMICTHNVCIYMLYLIYIYIHLSTSTDFFNYIHMICIQFLYMMRRYNICMYEVHDLHIWYICRSYKCTGFVHVFIYSWPWAAISKPIHAIQRWAASGTVLIVCLIIVSISKNSRSKKCLKETDLIEVSYFILIRSCGI